MKSVDLHKHRRQAAFGAAAGLLFVVITAVAIAASGCSGPGNANASSGAGAETKEGKDASKGAADKSGKPEGRTADQVLKDMEAAYRNTARYADEAKVHRFFTRDNDQLEQMFGYAVAFERPNKLRLECYDARVVIDGQNFFATVPHVPNVVMKVAAPEKIAPNDVVQDQQLGRALLETPAGPPPTLALLTQENSLQQMLRDAMAPPKLLAQETTDGHLCNRVELDTTYGKFLFWIDAATNILVRLDMPPLLSKQWDQNGEKTTGLTINFSKAQFSTSLSDETFKFDIPDGATVSDSLIPISKSTPPAARTEPTTLKLTKLWKASDVKNPGNVLVVDQGDGSTKVFVIDGARAVVELDGEGKVVARHELELPSTGLVTYLRTALDKQGKRYYTGSAIGQPQLHVFDENWKRILSFPTPEDAPNAQLTNVVFSDLAGDGAPELCVGYFGDTGVQGVGLDGNRIWRDRSLLFAQPATVTEPNADGKRRLLCTHQNGTIVIFDSEGKPSGEVVVQDRLVANILGADIEGTGKYNYCAVGYSQSHSNLAMGVALEGREQWIYDLPDGDPGRPVETISFADVAGDKTKEWLLAAPDSSVHILRADGTLLDKFNNGAALCGLAGAKFGEKSVLLISSALEKPEGDSHSVIEAWLVEPAGK